jgi:uncharacterized protein YcbK (DUF882 family)
MGDLTEHFSRSEFACKCGCGKDAIDYEVVKVLQNLRSAIDAPIRIASANRCEAHNKNVGGKPKSQHLLSKAVDFIVDGHNPRGIASYISNLYPERYGVGSYDNFTHLDSRSECARWGF